MRFAYAVVMSDDEVETAVARWHDAVNGRDLEAAGHAVTSPIVVNGPRGAGSITRSQFVEWIVQSGVVLRPVSSHPVGERIRVVEQDAHWPDDTTTTRVATVFRVTGDRVSAALRFPTADAALEFAGLYAEMAATE